MNQTPPPLVLPPELRALIASRGDGVLERVETFLAAAPRQCAFVTSERVAPHPLRRSWLGRRFGLPVASPVLGPLQSKFGGRCYQEEDNDWSDASFLGQLNFAELPAGLPGAPARGILAVDIAPREPNSFRVRWYPEPAEGKSAPREPPASVGTWETRLVFCDGWSRPESEADDLRLVADDPELWSAWVDWSPPGYDDPERQNGGESHQILGHRASGLDNHGPFQPAPGRSGEIAEYQMLWRITYDNPAGFDWGSNCVYVLIHRDDLVEGRLDRAVVAPANA